VLGILNDPESFPIQELVKILLIPLPLEMNYYEVEDVARHNRQAKLVNQVQQLGTTYKHKVVEKEYDNADEE